MTDDDTSYELSRRNVLAALGTVGVASAGAGLGTSAFFSDKESWDGNVLTAGSLDLKVDWEEHYSDWSTDESDGLEYDVLMEAPTDPPVPYVGLPDPQNPLIYVAETDLPTFMNNTSIEAFPDYDDDGIQDDTVDGSTPYYACDHGADTPEDLDPRTGLRTNSEDTIGTVDGNEEVYPLIYLEDLKPGDFGEATLSFHLCDNPGYVWLQGQLLSASENGTPEPEAKDPDEEEGVVELLDEIQTAWWYDEDGDNVITGGTGQPLCVELVLDSSGSMTATDGDGVSRNQEMKDGATQLAQTVLGASSQNQMGVVEFDDNATLLSSVANTGDSDNDGTTNNKDIDWIESQIDTVDADGGTDIAAAIEAADSDLAECPSGTRRIQIVVTDGENNDGTQPVIDAVNATTNTDEIFAVGTGGATQTSLEAIADPDDDAHVELTSDLTQAIANLGQILAGEEVFFRGTLREALDRLSQGNGIPLDGNQATAFDEINGDPADPNRECFNASDTQYLGFAWWLPVDHANEIMTDSVSFDLGFYAEQCRHNDGGGIPTGITTTTGTGFAKLSPTTNQESGYGQDGENFNGDGTISGGARARYGNNGPSGAGELYVGDEPGTSGEFNEAQHPWTLGGTFDWEVNYDAAADSLEFVVDGTGVTATLDDPQPDGRIAVQAKANEGTVTSTVDSLTVGGSDVTLNGPNSVTATDDDDGGDRDIEYVVINTALDGATDVSISGTGSLDTNDNYSGQEGVTMDVVFE